jgi:hypothetical protein
VNGTIACQESRGHREGPGHWLPVRRDVRIFPDDATAAPPLRLAPNLVRGKSYDLANPPGSTSDRQRRSWAPISIDGARTPDQTLGIGRPVDRFRPNRWIMMAPLSWAGTAARVGDDSSGEAMRKWRRRVESGHRARAEGRIDEAVRLYRSALPGAEREGEPVALGQLLHNLGLALEQAGEGSQARTVLERACALLNSVPAGGGHLGDTLRLLGSVEVELGNLEAGLALHERAIAHHESRGEADGKTRAQVDFGLALKDAGRLSEALAYLDVAVRQARRLDWTR